MYYIVTMIGTQYLVLDLITWHHVYHLLIISNWQHIYCMAYGFHVPSIYTFINNIFYKLSA